MKFNKTQTSPYGCEKSCAGVKLKSGKVLFIKNHRNFQIKPFTGHNYIFNWHKKASRPCILRITYCEGCQECHLFSFIILYNWIELIMLWYYVGSAYIENCILYTQVNEIIISWYYGRPVRCDVSLGLGVTIRPLKGHWMHPHRFKV